MPYRSCQTGDCQTGDCPRCIKHGANAYITKPYSHIVLMAYVNQLLDKSLASTDPIVGFGPYTFDTFHHRISGRGFESFDIPETGSRILEVLVRSPHPCMNTPTLIREAWGDDIRVQRTTLERNVDRLNEVFRDNGQPNVIRRIPRKEVDIYEVPCK